MHCELLYDNVVKHLRCGVIISDLFYGKFTAVCTSEWIWKIRQYLVKLLNLLVAYFLMVHTNQSTKRFICAT